MNLMTVEFLIVCLHSGRPIAANKYVSFLDLPIIIYVYRKEFYRKHNFATYIRRIYHSHRLFETKLQPLSILTPVIKFDISDFRMCSTSYSSQLYSRRLFACHQGALWRGKLGIIHWPMASPSLLPNPSHGFKLQTALCLTPRVKSMNLFQSLPGNRFIMPPT